MSLDYASLLFFMPYSSPLVHPSRTASNLHRASAHAVHPALFRAMPHRDVRIAVHAGQRSANACHRPATLQRSKLTSRASPRLKDADVDQDELQRLYSQLLLLVRRMFKICRLVHADLSEYNLLYHKKQIYIIDVSQSVEEDHPRAFDFLRVDITNMEDCFARRGARTLGPKRAWDFIVGNNHAGTEEVVDEWLGMEHDPADDAVFMSSFIPRTLGQVYDPERDIELVKAGKGDQLIYNQTLNAVPAATVPIPVEEQKGGQEESRKEQSAGDAQGDSQAPVTEHLTVDGAAGSGQDEDDSESEEEDGPKGPRGFRHEDRDAKKVGHSVIRSSA